MLATSKQINYLKALTKKVNHIYSVFPDCGITEDNANFYKGVNWNHERSMGMTTIDASLKIAAFKDLIMWINTKRVLMNKPQF